MSAVATPTATERIRNLAIIAHIDHGKTTLIDAILRECGAFRQNQQVQERIMDSNDQERERGITIFAKSATVWWEDYEINIVDTPGHADFSGEVERTLGMVDGCLLLVDAGEGPMPQTRYVLKRALALGLRPIVVLNKADRPNCNPDESLNEVFDLFMELGATDEQADFPHIYASALEGWAVREMEDEKEGLRPLFELIVAHVPVPTGEIEQPFQMQVTTLDWNEYVGRLFGGRVLRGEIRRGQTLFRVPVNGDEPRRFTLSKIWGHDGMKRVEREKASVGEILFLAGVEEVEIGDTICHPDQIEALPPLQIDEPTVSMTFLPNNSPFAGKDGKAVTIKNIQERLQKELKTNVSLRVKDLGQDGVEVSGRGELHLSVLIETLRREGWELLVSRPRVIFHEDSGKRLEPIEVLSIDVPEDYLGAVMERIAQRKAEIKDMAHGQDGRVRIEALIPTRGLVGYRSEFLTDTRGMGILASRFLEYGDFRGEVVHRTKGSLVAMETEKTTGYALDNLQQRAVMFVGPGEDVYEGQVVGENSREGDMVVNPCKKKQLTNMRASGSDDAAILTPPRRLTLEQAIEWITDDEMVEATPESIRIRKRILKESDRKRSKQIGGN
ncbi:MAG: GTP-binding protein TypA/BipA [bacterium]|nr:GTP-binding protein TypA/BipA [bacterium]